ncbi:EAL domain-containing protein [Thiolapillus brandeum]|uniref:Signal transduction protein n=1 Tax=Thiolapillus brandeum TaxID=1076588 RepID=A0A7U6JH90_9GAMM|nr:EAL domain-containing protein [Thiolapillus brandeum]BAO43552.1 signal transduction protein [Thiolapillus brandeum]
MRINSLDQSSPQRFILVLGILWTISILLIAAWTISAEMNSTLTLATIEARAYFNKDQAIRLWATQHGRIYVPETADYPPDPNLSHIPERDIVTPSGIALTLINPARIIRELDTGYGHLYGVTGRVTSLTPLAAENTPDAWETGALKRLYNGEQEVLEFTRIDGEEYLRLMQPLIANEGCLLCHKNQGFEIGKPGGGIGIKLPMKDLRAHEAKATTSKSIILLALWLIGIISLIIGARVLRTHAKVRQQMLDELTQSEKRKSAIVETALDCIITIDKHDCILEFNPAAERTFGYSRQEVLGKRMGEILVPPSLREMHYKGLRRQLQSGKSTILGTRIETTALHADGSEFPVELAITRIDEGEHILFTAYLRNIAESRKMAEQLLFQANHDFLTNLLNRHSFEQSLQELLDNSSNTSKHCLMYLDLDRFKLINDSCGHAAGDELLRQLASLLQNNIRDQDILGRLGGDEFGLILANCPLDCAMKIGNSLLTAARDYRFYWENKIFSIGLSIGLVVIANRNQPITELLRLADAACYRAKEEGRNRISITNQTDDEALHKQRGEIDWINSIESAFDQGRFLLYQQPIIKVDAVPGAPPLAMEILLRMEDPDDNLITPDNFLPPAERYNLISVIDRWVVRGTFHWLATHPDPASLPSLITINLSGASVADPLFLDFILEQLHTPNLPINKICLEITETVAITNLSRARRFISELREAGCLFALDDFGSGMSSYGYLKDLPVDFLKIDGKFVHEMDKDPISLAMVRSINEIGQLMGKKTIAEFVANQKIMDQLKMIGVDYAQGFYIGRPAPLNDLLPGKTQAPPKAG